MLHGKNAPTMGWQGNDRVLFSRVSCISQNHQKKNILSKVEGEKVMAYVSDEMLNETLLQYSTASIGDTQNFEVEDHEINISVAEHKVRQREEVDVQNEAARIVEVIVNVEGMDLTKTKEGKRYVNSEERLVLKG